MTQFGFHIRLACGDDHPAGITVSKGADLPAGDFRITEYCWGDTSLWFVDSDKFTDDERQAAYQAFSCVPKQKSNRPNRQGDSP